jgi:uncharacterized protein (TIRG00374 family)
MATETAGKSQGKKKLPWLHIILSVAIVVGLGLAANKYLRADEVMEAARSFNWNFAAPILILSVLYLWLKALRFYVLLRPLSDAPLGVVTRAYFAGQPATFVPGGVAARAGLLAQAGVSPAATGAPILHGSLLDQLMFVVATVGAALWFPAARPVALIGLGVLAVLALLFAIPAPRRAIKALLDKLMCRFGIMQHWEEFCVSLGAITKPVTMGWAILLSALAFIVPVFMFDLVLRGMDQPVAFSAVLLAYTIPSMVGRLTIIPGGLGLTEGGMIGMLAELANLNPNTGAAASALFRIADSFFQALVGAVIYFAWWKGPREAERNNTVRQPRKSAVRRGGRAAV